MPLAMLLDGPLRSEHEGSRSTRPRRASVSFRSTALARVRAHQSSRSPARASCRGGTLEPHRSRCAWRQLARGGARLFEPRRQQSPKIQRRDSGISASQIRDFQKKVSGARLHAVRRGNSQQGQTLFDQHSRRFHEGQTRVALIAGSRFDRALRVKAIEELA